MRPIGNVDKTSSTTVITATAATPSSPATTQPRSPWRSPVPYLFGGLAAMLGLIAFALLILACSYWKLSGRLDNINNNEGGDDRGDIESGNEEEGREGKAGERVYEEKILVVMAGNQKPTFLATPVHFNKASAFIDKNDKIEFTKEEEEKRENGEKIKNETTTTTTAETTEEEEEEEEEGNRERRETQQVEDQEQSQ